MVARTLGPLPTDPPWLTRAWQDLGKTETKDAAWVLSLPKKFAKWVQAYYTSATGQPWCALALSAWLADCGIRTPPNPLGARAYLAWGTKEAIDLTQKGFWRRGAIVVLTRLGGGHVGFLVDVRRVEGTSTTPWPTAAYEVALLGGNQSNRVQVQWFPAERVIGVRWPAEFQ